MAVSVFYPSPTDNYKICTSSTRPTGAALIEGTLIYETDTDLMYVYDNANWDPVFNAQSAVAPVQIGMPITKYKTADQSVSVTSFADDTHLTFSISSTGTYVFEGYLWTFSGATTTGAKIAINGPTASTINFGAMGAITQGAAGAASTFFGNSTNAYNAATTLGATNVGTTTATAAMINFAGHIVATATGTLVLRLAGEAAASITYKLGSWMRVTKVA